MTRSRALIASVALALAAAASPSPLTAQEEPAARFGERIQVTEVLLDVLVSDADGNVVVGLDAGDFVVEENGQPVHVASATFYGSQQLLSSPALAGRLHPDSTAADGRFFILFFHDLRREAPVLMREQRNAAAQSRRWLEESLSDQDWVAVVSYYAKLRIHQDFTRDRELLSAALDSVSRGEDPGATWSIATQVGEEPSLTRYLAQGKELRKQTGRIQDGLKVLAEAAANTRGRKNLVFFSIGFGDVDRFGWRPDQRYYPPAQQALNDANVAVYAVSLAQGSFRRDPVIEALSHSLSQLAIDTGGRHYQTFANFAGPLKEVVADNGGYYLLSYSAEYPAGDGGYREVTVATTNPTLRVRARDGYLFGD
jgi:VWFA-related protein